MRREKGREWRMGKEKEGWDREGEKEREMRRRRKRREGLARYWRQNIVLHKTICKHSMVFSCTSCLEALSTFQVLIRDQSKGHHFETVTLWREQSCQLTLHSLQSLVSHGWRAVSIRRSAWHVEGGGHLMAIRKKWNRSEQGPTGISGGQVFA